MTLTLIKSEVQRFLLSREAEVICIKGKWGVGKTFAWKAYLEEFSGTTYMDRYSYISLFGLNSLDDLRFSIFENTVTRDNFQSGPNEKTFRELWTKPTDLGRKARPLLEGTLAFFNRKAVGDLLFKSAFMSVRNQMICLDDLERAGTGLHLRDVLGLVSFLKVERNCKVVLLLNDEELGDQTAEFQRNLEKIADVSVVFNPAPQEAAEIGLKDSGDVGDLIGPRLIELGITNIRVIKKIERMARRLKTLLERYPIQITEQAMAITVLCGWSVHQPSHAPPIEFLRKYSRVLIMMRGNKEVVDQASLDWEEKLNGYPYSGLDGMDTAILDGLIAGYFDDERILAEAVLLQKQLTATPDTFSEAWQDLYHGNLSTDDDTFLDALYSSALENLPQITLLNLNSAVRLLRDCGRTAQADEIVSRYINARSDEGRSFFDVERQHLVADEKLDDTLVRAFADKLASFKDLRDPVTVLENIAATGAWNEQDVALLGGLGPDDLEKILLALRGKPLRVSLKVLRTMCHSGFEESEALGKAINEAVRRIASMSPLRARRLQSWGFRITDTNSMSLAAGALDESDKG